MADEKENIPKEEDQSARIEIEDLDVDQKIEVKRQNTAFHGPMAISPDDLDSKAVDDIAKTETEKAMEAEDEKLVEEFVGKKSFKDRLSVWFHSWWDVPKKRYTVLGVLGVLFVAFFAFPATRYAALNTVGFRGSATLVVTDESTNQPLKNVDVTIQDKTAKTDIDGRVTIADVKLGSTEVKVDKIAYAEEVTKQTIGMGENQLAGVALEPIGSRFSFRVIDWLSGNPLPGAEVSYRESSALADDDGVAVLTIEPTDDSEISVSTVAEHYRDQGIEISTLDEEDKEVRLRTANPSFFVSNRSGTYDIYKGYVDEDPSVIVAGSGSEREDIRFAVSPDRKQGVLVSTRDGNRNEDGFLLSGLYIVDLETSQLSKIDESEKIDLVGWVDGKLVYVKIAAGASGNNPQRHRLIILNLEDGGKTELAASNYFNDVIVTQNKVFYAPSDAYKDNPDTALFKSDSDGRVNKVHDSEVWTIFQSSFNELTYDAVGEWYNYQISEDSAYVAAGPPSDRKTKLFVGDESNEKFAWVDQRDGKGVLLIHKPDDSGDDQTLVSQSGLRHPVQWLSSKHIVYRVSNSSETADYIVNIEGGEPQKINDVSNVSGTDRWYYYY